MSNVFSTAERAYLAEPRLGRLMTIGEEGRPDVVPVEWRYNDVLDTVDVTGRDLAGTAPFRNVQRQRDVVIVIEDLPPRSHPSAMVVEGTAEPLDHLPIQYVPSGTLIRITPTRVVSVGIKPDDE